MNNRTTRGSEDLHLNALRLCSSIATANCLRTAHARIHRFALRRSRSQNNAHLPVALAGMLFLSGSLLCYTAVIVPVSFLSLRPLQSCLRLPPFHISPISLHAFIRPSFTSCPPFHPPPPPDSCLSVCLLMISLSIP